MALLLWLGFVPGRVAEAPPVARSAEQLKMDASLISSYGTRHEPRASAVGSASGSGRRFDGAG